MRSEAEAGRAVYQYADTVRRVCFIHLKNHHDVEDVFQEVFLKYVLYKGVFESDNHEKAWILRVAINACKDLQRSFFRRKVSSFEDLGYEPYTTHPPGDTALLDAVCKLPENYKNVIYLCYYEGYSAVEIANMLGKKENTIYTWLSRAKMQLKDMLGGDFLGE